MTLDEPGSPETMAKLQKLVGKTIKAIDLRALRGREELDYNLREEIVLTFSDGTKVEIGIGSNAGNLSVNSQLNVDFVVREIGRAEAPPMEPPLPPKRPAFDGTSKTFDIFDPDPDAQITHEPE